MARPTTQALAHTAGTAVKFLARAVRSLSLPSYGGGGWLRTLSGEWGVDEERTSLTALEDRIALSSGTVWACCDYIAGSIALCPWRVLQKVGKKTEPQDQHPVYWMLYRQPNPEINAFDFRHYAVLCCLLYGNFYAEIERDVYGRPVALWQIDPRRVTVDRDANGALIYIVYQDHGPPVHLAQGDVYHVKGMGDGVVGTPVLTMAARSFGLDIAAEAYGRRWFRNNSTPSGVLSTPGSLDEDSASRVRKAWQSNYGGSGQGKIAVLENGVTFQSITIPQDQMQFLETRQFSVTAICRWFRVPPAKVAHMEGTSYNSLEELNIAVVGDTLAPWAKRFEEEADRKLLASNWGNRFSQIDLRALMRGSHADRAEYYRRLFSIGALAPNEAREKEDLPPMTGGDETFVPMNMLPVSALEDMDWAAKGGGGKTTPAGGGPPGDGGDVAVPGSDPTPDDPKPSDTPARKKRKAKLMDADLDTLDLADLARSGELADLFP